MMPLFMLVLYVGCQRWRKQRSGSSHLDIFTYNVIVLEMISLLACCLYCSGGLRNVLSLTWVALDIFNFTSNGQSAFHVLTCVERYLAVVHPITYMSLKQSGGVRIRNLSIGCVWLLCFAEVGKSKVLSASTNVNVHYCILIFFISIVTFCSFSVLWILIHPGPGKRDGDRECVDQSKRRAFYTITAIMGVLWMRFFSHLVVSVLSHTRFTYIKCVARSSLSWLTIPGSLVLPLLFLNRAGKLAGCKKRSK